MRWTKRLKLLRISKVIIPIALAVSLVFAGFSVFAREAENFVVRTNGNSDVKLSLTFNKDLTEQTSMLYAPAGGFYRDVTFKPDENLLYSPDKVMATIPNDIASHDGMHSCYNRAGEIMFYSFSFYLVNNSDRAVDVDMIMNIDGVVPSASNDSGYHVDDAIKVMLIVSEDGYDPLISDGTYTVYSKREASDEDRETLYERIEYEDRIVDFTDNGTVFKREGDTGFKSMGRGATIKFTLVLWLEGHDANCKDPILGEEMKMSIDFMGY